MNNVFFISGIDTGCGKTYVTGLLAKYLCSQGIRVITQKMVQTGCVGISEDILEHRRIMGYPVLPEDNEGLTCPYVLSFPASPHLASELENTTIDTQKITAATKKLSQSYDVVLIEGAGGLCAPINNEMLVIDYIRQQGYPIFLISSSKLGSINHTLLSVECCHYHRVNLANIIYNCLPGSNDTIARSTYQFIGKILQEKYPNVGLTALAGLGQNKEIMNLFNKNHH